MGIKTPHSCWLSQEVGVSMEVNFSRSDLVMCLRSFEFFKILGNWGMDGSSYPCC